MMILKKPCFFQLFILIADWLITPDSKSDPNHPIANFKFKFIFIKFSYRIKKSIEGFIRFNKPHKKKEILFGKGWLGNRVSPSSFSPEFHLSPFPSYNAQAAVNK